jgi:SWIM zinc finger
MKATATVLAKVEDTRFHRAIDGTRSGTYQVKITLRNEDEVRGLVKIPNGAEYGCSITPAGAFCSCPDALYRGIICKHAVVLALYVVRHPARDPADQVRTPPEEQRPYNLKLGRVRPDCVSCP